MREQTHREEREGKQKMRKLIVSCDTGVDDALAIAYAIGQTKMELLGITVSYGMSLLGNTYRNTRHMVKLLGDPVKVYMGSAAPLVRPPKDYVKSGSRFHGMDGVCNQLGPFQEEDLEGAREEEAIDFIIGSIHRYQKDLTLVTTGPLTDLARVIQKDPSVIGEIGSVVSMAGAVASPGNIDQFKEANAALDPEATKLVLEAELPLVLVGLDVTRKTLLTEEDWKRWKTVGTQRAEFLCGCLNGYLDAYREFHPYLKGCALHDPLAVGAALYPEWLTTVPMHLTCLTEGPGEGRTCEDLSRCADEYYRSRAAMLVDKKAFEHHFFETVEKLLQEDSAKDQP